MTSENPFKNKKRGQMQAVSNTYHLKVADTRYRSNEQMNWFWMTRTTEIAELILSDVPKKSKFIFYLSYIWQ